MTFFDINAAPGHAHSPARDDLVRLALALLIFAALAVGIMLATGLPGAPFAAQPHTGVEWHGNVAASQAI